MNRKVMGYIYMILSAFCFSLMGILSKLIFKFGIGSLDLIIIQNIIQVLILGVYFAAKRFKPLIISWKDFKTIGIQGFFGSIPVFIFYYLTLERLNASISCLLLFTNPIFITLYFILFEGRKNNWIKTCAIVITFIGSVFVLNITPGNLGTIDILGITFGFISSIAYAFYNIYAEKKLVNYDPGVILFYCCLIIVFVVSIMRPSFYVQGYFNNIELVFYVSILSVVASILPVVFLYTGINYLGAQIASVAATLEIPFTLLLSVIVLKENLYLIQIAGSIMIGAAILMLNKAENINCDVKVENK